MKEKLHNRLKTLFSIELTYQERMTRIILAMTFVASIIGMGRVFLGTDAAVLRVLVLMAALSAAAFVIAVKYKKPKLASWINVLAANMILFPLLFFMSGGMQSGTPIWFVLGLVYIFLLFEGKELLIAFFVSLLSFLGAFTLAYAYPSLLTPAPNRWFGYTDSYITLVFVSIFIGFLLKSQVRTYDREKKLAEKQKEEIEQIARSKDVFFANMSHEIRTPINTIIGLNEMILRDEISDEIAENAINIQNAGKMLLTTINDILDLSKLESGKMEIVPVQYEVSAMFSDLVNLIWIRAQQKELEFKVDIDRNIPSMLYGDEVRIKQVVTNMLTNAVKYTANGSVTLTAKGERIAPDAIMLRICVEDTGMGIKKESLDDLFRSFKRVDETANRNIEGTGLGLTISKQLIEMMGGKIYVDSVYHKGSVFTIELKQNVVNARPIGIINFAAQKQLDYHSKYVQSFTAPDAKILVVDDNDMNRMVAIKLLRGTKVNVDTAESGKECLKKTAETAYHVILMDHMMPEMDGEQTMRAIRQQAKGFCQKTPIVALTANVMTNAKQVYEDMGFDGYLAKPINAALLEACLLKYLPQDLIEFCAAQSDSESAADAINQFTGARKRKVAVTADCICDLPAEWIQKFQIRLMYLYVHTKEGRFCDISEISSDSLLDYLKIEGNYAHSSTASPSEYEYFFADALLGAEQVLHLTATADLSDAWSCAHKASKSFDNVTVFDSCHISSGHGIMTLYAAVLAERGRSVAEICRELDMLKDCVFSNFLVPRTDALYRNKKVNGTVHKLCTLLGLHPVLYMTKNRLKVWQIMVGNIQKVNRRYVKKLMRRPSQIDRRILFLTYAGCSMQQLDDILEEIGRYVSFEQIVLQKASATVSSNCGVGTFGVIFIRRK